MADPLRVAFIGAGGNTTLRHLPGLLELDNIQAVAVCNRSAESGQRVADQFGIARVETDPAAIFDADDVDAISIGTWPYRHREYTVRALEAGKHVLCEARMAMNATEAREMLAASQARPDLVAQLVPAPMDLLVWRTVRRLMGEHVLGTVREAHVDVTNGSAIDASGPLHWRHQTEYSGKNVMMFGIFTEIVSRWLGATERVMADGATFITSRHDEAEDRDVSIDIPDSLGVFADLQSGARVSYRISTVTHAAPPLAISVYGSEATLHWRGGDDLTLVRIGGEPEVVTPDEGTAIGWNVERDFVDSIRDNKPVELTNLDDGLHYMQLTEAVHRSLAEGRAVNLADV
jgi:predicted dehydrogenase